MKFTAIVLVAVLVAVDAQLQLNGGSTFGSLLAKPYVITPTIRKYATINRQYSSSNFGSTDGQYRPDNSGAYNANDGQYYADNSGSYVHQDSKYQHTDEKYKHLADKYGGSGGDGGQYRDSSYNVQSGAGAGSGFKSVPAKKVPSVIVNTDSASHARGGSESSILFGTVGFGEPVALQKGSSQGKYDNKNYGIIRQTGKIEGDGYHYLYETENGILGEEQGKLANRDTDNEAMHATGFFTYTGPDAIVYTVNYVADENGFQPDAAHLPTPPPVPAYILRALDYQRSIGTLVD